MIDVKQAVKIAEEKALEMLSETSPSLEEIERETYNDRDVWSITLGFPRKHRNVDVLVDLGIGTLQYKRFLIDVESGEFVAMKLREFALR